MAAGVGCRRRVFAGTGIRRLTAPVSDGTYTAAEVEEIRREIASLENRPDIGEAAETAVAEGRCPPPLAPLWGLSSENPALFERLCGDAKALTYSIFGFFPKVYDWVYGQETPPAVTWEGRTRGLVALLDNADDGAAVKPKQSRREDEIAAIAGELGVGPGQRDSLPGFLCEDLVRGRFFTELPVETVAEEFWLEAGERLGRMLAALHGRGICYNDATFSDPEGRSHLLVDEDGGLTLIDFGVSVLLDRHPRLEGEEVFNLLRTDPMFRVFRGMASSPEDIQGLVYDYGRRLAGTSKEGILSRDLRFAEQGIGFVAQRMGERVGALVGAGFRDGYG